MSDSNTDDKSKNPVQILPVFAAPRVGRSSAKDKTIKVKRKARHRKVELMPTESDLEYHAIVMQERARLVAEDPIVKAAEKKMNPAMFLGLIKAQIAREAAELACQRTENQKFGKDTTAISSRRIDALYKISALEIEISKMTTSNIDFGSEAFQRVFMFWLETVKEVAQEVLSPEQMDLFFNKLELALKDWEERAQVASQG